jgi:hypothetical protein
MENKYVNFISDEHLLKCVANLHKAYLKAKNNVSKKSFYSNKVDTIKLTFDSKFNDIDEESLIQSEILRQIDKSINKSIGTFHEQILGGIEGYEVGVLSGYDVKATDDSLFADIVLDELPYKYEEFAFNKLAEKAKFSKNSMCYLVILNSENSFYEKFTVTKSESTISHKKVFKISGDKFYSLLSGRENALFELYESIPVVIDDYLKSVSYSNSLNSVFV